MDNIDRLISEQVHSWSQRESKDQLRKAIHGEWPVITISRQYGAMGKALAEELGKRTGFKVWDKELVKAIADETGADEKLLSSLDERRRKMIEDLIVGSLMGTKHSNTSYFRTLLRVIHAISIHGEGIVVGRGGNYIIKTPDSLNVRVVCPMEDRIPLIAEREGMSEKDAEKMINVRDAERVDFIKYYFKKEPDNANDYDLVLNSGIFTIEEMADLVLLAYEKKAGKAIPVKE